MIFLLRLLSRLPLWWLYRVSDLLFPLVYYVVRYRRKVVRGNLTRSFPNFTEREIRQTERKFYHFFCDYGVETLKLLTISPEELKKRMRFTGVEKMDASLATHPLCFLMVGHFGNWEWLSTFVNSTTFHCAQLYTPLHSQGADRLFLRLRSRFGTECIAKRDALRRILSLCQQGVRTHIGFIADQSPYGNSIHYWMPFLNQDTPIFTGAERIARKVGAAAWFGRMTRVKRGYYVCHLEPLADNVAALPPYQMSDLFMRRLEQEIIAAPHLWLWTHRRWKHRRPEAPSQPPQQAHGEA